MLEVTCITLIVTSCLVPVNLLTFTKEQQPKLMSLEQDSGRPLELCIHCNKFTVRQLQHSILSIIRYFGEWNIRCLLNCSWQQFNLCH